MSIRLTKIDKDAPYEQDGFNRYVKDVDVAEVDRGNFDGMLSLCIDARLAVTQIYNHFKTKEPVSTAGNALFSEIKSLSIPNHHLFNDVWITLINLSMKK